MWLGFQKNGLFFKIYQKLLQIWFVVIESTDDRMVLIRFMKGRACLSGPHGTEVNTVISAVKFDHYDQLDRHVSLSKILNEEPHASHPPLPLLTELAP